MSQFQSIKELFAKGLSLSKLLAKLLTLPALMMAWNVTQGAAPDEILLSWNPVPDSRVARYEVHYGLATGEYKAQVAATSTTASVSGLTPGLTYYFAARACDSGSTCSGYSNEVSATIPFAAPVADFVADKRSGLAPVTVTFACQSTGSISTRTWRFGDGTSSTAATAVKTYTAPGTYEVSLSVSGPGGEDTEAKSGYIEVKAPAPIAGFTGTPLKGPAPLTVAFQNTSTGQIGVSDWSFGDGSKSGETHPSHTYTVPGVYAVTLTVSGTAGANSLTQASYIQVESSGDGNPAGSSPAELPMELGEVLVDHNWRRVSFSTPFTNPIVVAKPLSYNGSDPAVVRVKGVDATGFWIRVQEWDYLDGRHASETVSYLVIERGRHQLPDGAWVEAGRLVTGATNSFVTRSFSEPLYETPVVFATVTTVNEADAVTTRLRKVTVKGFEVGMREQESKPQKHLAESIDYVAFEPSFGVVNGLRYEIGFMAGGVTDKPKTLLYQGSYAQEPLFLADMQTTNGIDTANLRWRNRNEASLELWVSEEKSKDSEIAHTTESIGYFAGTKD